MSGYDWMAIKAHNPIAEVIGNAVQLKRKGNEYSACCPFHAEKTPSFTVNPDKGFYHCFGCGAHGDVVDFIAQYQSISPEEAIAALHGGEVRLTDANREERKALMAEREAAQMREKEAATRKAIARWDNAEPCEAHPYLARKGVAAHSCRIEGDKLLLPIYDAAGDIQSVQTIAADGKKLFQPGAPTSHGRMTIGIHMGRTIICEGFATGASIHEAVPDQVCVTFSKGNMHKIAREMAAQGTSIVLAADTGAETEMRKLAKELGCPVIIPACGGDFNDQHATQGVDSVAASFTKGLRAYADEAKAKAEEAMAEAAPTDLWARYTPPTLPTGILPLVIEQFARTQSEQMGVDPGGLAMSALTVCASVIRDSIRIKVKQHEKWTESARIWTMLIGDPSYKKSPIMRAAASKVKELDAEMLYANNRALLDWQDGGKAGEKPPSPRLRIEDITMESAQEVCRYSPEGILVLQDELSGWFGGIEKYSGGKGGAKDRSFWLQAYGGGQYAVNRVGRGEFIIDNLSVSILGGVQPDPIRRIVSDATDDGLIQRFIPVVLQPSRIGKDEEMPDVAWHFAGLIERLHDLRPVESVLGKLPLQFDDGARAVREKLEAKHHHLVCGIEAFNKKFAAHIGKFDGLFPRLCIIWHCIEHIDAPELPIFVSEDTARRVASFLTNYIMKHSMAFYFGLLGLSDDNDDLCDVAGYILAHGEETVTQRILSRGSRRMKRLTREEGARIFEQLETFGWLEQSHKRSDAPMWKVNPEVHTMFAAKAEEERARRSAVRTIIRDMENEEEF